MCKKGYIGDGKLKDKDSRGPEDLRTHKKKVEIGVISVGSTYPISR